LAQEVKTNCIFQAFANIGFNLIGSRTRDLQEVNTNCIFQAFANIGFNLISWGLLGELYPTAVAGLAGGVTTCLANLMGFAAIKLYPGFQEATTGAGFFFFGAVACVGTVFVFLFLPETFKKSLEQIGQEFRQPCRRNVFCC
jgi:hypothetical protein